MSDEVSTGQEYRTGFPRPHRVFTVFGVRKNPCEGPVKESDVRISVSEELREFVRAHGGRLYVWTSTHRCCTGPLTLLEASTTPPPHANGRFRREDAGGLDLFLALGHRAAPEELVLELKGRRGKVAAYWNDRAWVD